MADLHLSRDPALGRRAGLERALRDAVRSGRLRPGERLPSSRELAGHPGAAPHTLADGYPRGPWPARSAIAAYLARTRGVVADPQLVILGAGYRQAVSLVAAALRDLGRFRVAVESPGLPEVPQALRRAGLDVAALPV